MFSAKIFMKREFHAYNYNLLTVINISDVELAFIFIVDKIKIKFKYYPVLNALRVYY